MREAISEEMRDEGKKVLEGREQARLVPALLCNSCYDIFHVFGCDLIYTKHNGCAQCDINHEPSSRHDSYARTSHVDYVFRPAAGVREMAYVDYGLAAAYQLPTNNSILKRASVLELGQIFRAVHKYFAHSNVTRVQIHKSVSMPVNSI